MSLDYTAIAAQIGRKSEADYTISPASYVLFLSSLAGLRGWLASGTELTDEQWDNVDSWVAGAYNDLLDEVECEECEECEDCEVIEYDIFDDFKTINTNGQTIAGAGNIIREFNTAHSMNAGNVTLYNDRFTTAVAGRYLVSGWCSENSLGNTRLHLNDWLAGTAVIIGITAKSGSRPHFSGIVDCAEDREFYMMHRVSESGNGGVPMNANYDEHYAHIRWERLGDTPT